MDLSSLGGLSSAYTTAQNAALNHSAESLANSVDGISKNASEEELKGVLKDFESYFVEQIIKKMKDTFTHEDENADSTMSQYRDMYMDMAISKVAGELVDQVGESYTQQLYEQMKRNYSK